MTKQYFFLHIEPRKNTCKKCGINFLRRDQLEKHLAEGHGVRPYKVEDEHDYGGNVIIDPLQVQVKVEVDDEFDGDLCGQRRFISRWSSDKEGISIGRAMKARRLVEMQQPFIDQLATVFKRKLIDRESFIDMVIRGYDVYNCEINDCMLFIGFMA